MKQFLMGILALGITFGQAPDNSKTNQRDRDGGAVTADDQKMNKTDLEVAQKIRQSVYGDKTLSTYAHNVKIISQDGRVTLKGPVRNQAEVDNVVKKAVAVVGQGRVTNQLEIAPAK
jgi:osmotically-inducible protein OsmY